MHKVLHILFEIGAGAIVLGLIALGLLLNTHLQTDTTIKRDTTSGNTAKVDTTPASLLSAVNAERAKNGVPPLTEDPRLDATAQAKCEDETNSNYYDHVSPTGVRGDDLIEAALNHAPGYYDENLAEPYPNPAQSAVEEWIQSPDHHTAMINPHYTITGFGISGKNVCEDFFGPK